MEVPPDGSDVVRVLDEQGAVTEDASVPDLDDDALLAMYRDIRFARRFDRRAVSLTRQGRLGSYPPMRGHEAAQVASAHALDATDWVVPTYRDHAAQVVHGVDPAALLRYFGGREVGNRRPAEVNVLPINGAVGSQVPHATGVAWAAARRDATEAAVVCYLGDGATSEGDFHEGLNFAGVFDVPAVFLCQNNQWAISVPVERQTAAATLARKAAAYGITGVRVDGTDPLAVYRVTRDAVGRAKAAGGAPGDGPARPTLIEAVLYRLGPHSTAEDPSRYRDGVPDAWEGLDPVERFEAFLRRTGRLDDEAVRTVADHAAARVEEAVERAVPPEPPAPGRLFEDTFATPPSRLREQAARLSTALDRHGEPRRPADE